MASEPETEIGNAENPIVAAHDDLPAHCVAHALRQPTGFVPRINPAANLRESLEELVDGDSPGVVVEEAGHLYGVFTFQSFCEALLDVVQSGQSLDRWFRDTMAQEAVSAEKTMLQSGDSLLSALPLLEETSALAVAGPNILSYRDVMVYFADKTRAVLEIERVEVGVRTLAALRIPQDAIEEAIALANADFAVGPAHGQGVAQLLESLSMHGLISLFLNRVNYENFFTGFFNSHASASSTLYGLSDLRNEIFHFRGVTDPIQAKRLTRAATLVDTFVRSEHFKHQAADMADGD